MVSKASDDLPEPESPVITTSWSRGISRSMFFRVCSRAPRATIRALARAPHYRSWRRARWGPLPSRADETPGAERSPREGNRGECRVGPQDTGPRRQPGVEDREAGEGEHADQRA